ncbi:MAG: FKBP-type peptidyl-prolyl cis-trans isomerase, partial [Patescibacteria group bacterium]|nr:FKBP-type peptidyl-prolyl cis-trans isomerase [Patescibacteria group bacterium]
MRKFGTGEWVAVGVAIAAVAYIFFGQSIWSAFSGPAQVADQSAAPSVPVTGLASSTTTMQNTSTIQGLEIYDEQVGTGTPAQSGDSVTVNYTGYLADGTKFDSSYDHGQPFTFALGAGQ